MRDASSHSLDQVLPMRRHLQDIAELLEDIMVPEVQSDASALHEVMRDVQSSSEAARNIAMLGKQKFEQVSQELHKIQQQYQASKAKAEQKRETNQKLADEKDRTSKQLSRACVANTGISVTSGSVTLGGSGGGVAALAGGASWVASVPGIGAALTTTTATTSSAGGVWGALGYTVTTTSVAFNPVGIMVGVALALGFGLLAVKSGCDACDYSRQSRAQKPCSKRRRPKMKLRHARLPSRRHNKIRNLRARW